MWEKHSNLKFRYKPRNADAIISYKWDKHNCSRPFDGDGGVLAHAYYRRPGKNKTEVHMHYQEPWYYGNDTNVPDDKIIDEIGNEDKRLIRDIDPSFPFDESGPISTGQS